MALQKLGKYEIRSELGRGAMGVVYKAYDPILEREVALKTMMATMGGMDADSKSRFYREARSAAKLTHRNIVTIFDMGEEQGIPFIAMEFLDGIDLHRKLKFGGPLPLREGLDIVSQVLHGLHYAHQYEIVHRDIKPANIYILRNGTAKILDFGIAKLASSEMTRTGMVLGTVDYMSPEQIRADKAVDGRSDLFSAGVILYEFIAGRRPLPGETITSVMYKIVHEPSPTLPQDRHLPVTLTEIVARALVKDPGKRFRNGQEFAQAIEGVIGRIDAAIPTMRMEGAGGDSKARFVTARRLFDSGSFQDSAALLKQVIDQDPSNTDAIQLMSIVERRASGDATMILDAEPEGASPASHSSSIEEILEEVEEERRQSTASTGPRSEAGARDLTLRLEDSDIGSGTDEAPGKGRRPGQRVTATEIVESPESGPPEPPAPPPPARPAPRTPPPAASARAPAAKRPAAREISPTATIETPGEGPRDRAEASTPIPAAPPRPGVAQQRPVARTDPAVPPPAKSVSPVMIGVAALVIVGGVLAAWLALRGGSAEEPGPAVTESPAPSSPTAPPAVAAPASGYIAVDAQPWAQVVEIRDKATGKSVDLVQAAGRDATTPLMLSLGEGTYQITLRHPDYGEVSIADVRVAAGQSTAVNPTMPGFSYSSMMPSAP